MTGADHVWRRAFGWAYCSRCGVVRHSGLGTQCRGVVDFALASETASSAPHDGEQSPTSDEREIDRLRLEVARLQRVIANSASSLDGLLADASEMGYQAHPRLVDALRWLARDLRGALDQGAPR